MPKWNSSYQHKVSITSRNQFIYYSILSDKEEKSYNCLKRFRKSIWLNAIFTLREIPQPTQNRKGLPQLDRAFGKNPQFVSDLVARGWMLATWDQVQGKDVCFTTPIWHWATAHPPEGLRWKTKHYPWLYQVWVRI